MIDPKIEIRHLRLIQAIEEFKSLTKAAERLYVTPSALSHQLKELETALGSKVFSRVGKRMIVTESGRVLLHETATVLAKLDNAFEQVRKMSRGEYGQLRICTECYTGYHWLPPILKDFNKKFPDVEIVINTEDITKPLTQLLKGKLDVALVFRKEINKNIRYHSLFIDELVAVVPSSHPWTKMSSVSAADFKNEIVITHSKNFEETSLHQRVFSPARIKPKRVNCVQITEAAIEMVKAGLGVAVMAAWAVESYKKDKKIVTIPINKGLVRHWYAAVLKNGENPPYVDYLISKLQQKVLMNGLPR